MLRKHIRPKRVIDSQVYTESTLVEQSTPVALQFQDRDLGVVTAKVIPETRCAKGLLWLRETQETLGFKLNASIYVYTLRLIWPFILILLISAFYFSPSKKKRLQGLEKGPSQF